MGKKYSWLKLKKDFFKRHDIRIIESMPNGKEYSLFYLKLLVESIDHEGALRFSDTIPYNEQMLSVITDTNIDVVRAALGILTQLGLVEKMDDETLYMTELETMIGTQAGDDEYRENARRRMQEYRARQKQIACREPEKETEVLPLRNNDVTCYGEKEIRDKSKEKDIYIPPAAEKTDEKPKKEQKHKHGEYKNVLLTDDEYTKLQDRFGNSTEAKIQALSEGKAMKGYKYKSDYLAILNWAKNDEERAAAQTRVNINSKPNSFRNFENRSTGTYDIKGFFDE